MVPVDDGATPVPIDRSVLERIRLRFAGRRLFESVEIIEEGTLYLNVELSGEYHPGEVSARVEIRWYRNDDFSVHYKEDQPDSTWKCRWDRHPNTHNYRDHFHPPPAASRTDAENSQWPPDHREVSRLVLKRIEDHIDTLWE
jgi:hypothetical protein